MGSPQPLSRPFTLCEALPYTPFTSIVPFDPGVLPAPSIGTASPAHSLVDIVPSQEYDALNQEALGHDQQSRRLQQTLNQVQHLMDRGAVTEFKFKTGPRPSKASSKKHTSLAATLTPLSKMVYEQAAVPFRYPTPDTPTPSPPPHPNGKQVQARAAVPPKASPLAPKAELKTSSPAVKNKASHAQNAARLEIVLPTKSQLERAASLVKPSASPTIGAPVTPSSVSQIPRSDARPQSRQREEPTSLSPQVPKPKDGPVPSTPKSSVRAPSGSQKMGIAVELPKFAFNKSEFLVVPDEPDEPISLSARKRKREGLDGDDGYGDSLDFRQRSDAAFRELKGFMQQVRDAESHAQHTQFGNDYIILTSDNQMTLSSQAQVKAQSLLNKAISLNCFKNVPLEELLRLQQLCDNALKQAESLDFKVETSWAADDAEHWVQQLPSLQVAILAARTTLRMMCGGRDDKQLTSENTIERCLDLVKGVTDGIVIPVAELRSSGNTGELFKWLSPSKKKLVALFNDCQKLFALMAVLISKIETSGTVTSGLEYAASQLVFMETANSEKESVIETQKFDGLRLAAMDMLSQIFLLNPTQRQGIFDDIMSSLEKLPLGKRARTFKLVGGSSIQPVSALIMRLVQTSAGKVDDERHGGRSAVLQSIEDDAEAHASNPNGKRASSTISDADQAASEHTRAIEELTNVAGTLMDTAQRNANYVIKYIVSRALKSTKSGDTPYRNLLDLFVEDFILCLDNPDWPAAEILLRTLMKSVLGIMSQDKISVPAKNMALEVLGSLGAAIAKLTGYVRKTANGLDARDPDGLGSFLRSLAESALERRWVPDQVLAWVGPYRATLEYLEGRFAEDPHLASAITFIVSDWAFQVITIYDKDEVLEHQTEYGRNAYRLREMVEDRQWLTSQYSFKTDVTVTLARLSYSIILLRSPLCQHFKLILNELLGSMNSDQPTVRSKSLKSINQVLEADPSVLNYAETLRNIIDSSSDDSIQVRDSALGLIGKCISLRPELEGSLIQAVLDRVDDSGLGVRKRAMKLAKDIYLRNTDKGLRSSIANALLLRTRDPDESVRDLAHQMMEEIWFTPFHNGENSAISQTTLTDHVSLMVQTVKRGAVALVLDKVLQVLLAPASKTSQASREVCKKLVVSMFELMDNEDSADPAAPSTRDVLQVLVIFAKADASLFSFEQLCLLKPAIQSILTTSDLDASRAVVMIFRRVLPQLSSAHSSFLEEVRNLLLPAVAKIQRSLVDDIIACSWIISLLLKDFHNLSTLLSSVITSLVRLRTSSAKGPFEGKTANQFIRLALILGMIGKHCQLDGKLGGGKDALIKVAPKWSGESVSKLMVDTLLPFADSKFSLEVRRGALDAVGLVCESSPRNYASPNVYATFQEVFESDPPQPELESKILRSLKEFLHAEEKRSEQDPDADVLNGKTEKKRELTVIGGTNYDDVASATTARFLQHIIRIATSTQSNYAHLAVEVLASINRQGLVHPKETSVTFITLETSLLPQISECAFHEHQRLHAKHETVVEREYTKALQAAFAYQRDIASSPRGASKANEKSPLVSKLHLWMEVLKISRSKNRQKFLEKLCAQIDFDVSKLNVSGEIPPHAQYAEFIVENLAFFEYLTVGEVLTVVSAIEKLVSSTGAALAQAIESEVLGVRMDALGADTVDPSAQANPTLPEIDPRRRRQLATGATILHAAWEVRTYLRRLYNMGTNRREAKAKAQAKDLSKAPVKVQGVTGDKLWDDLTAKLTALTTVGGMMETLKSFVDLLRIDDELRVRDEDEDGEDPATPSMDEDEEADEPSAGRGRKRKAQGNTPGGRKKRARSSSQPRKRGRPRKVVAAAEDLDADGEFEDWA
ncbi:putative SCC2 protein [Cercophora newfieldiana]|uniref:Sister chromatid cohesion protein n=1 Tax=Cercophora newfieldiana TaxID=92897 RepID=A0AA40CN52_9PEZI|nr:putative SCC2 protein [Cercophora newfieldiana]